LLIRTVLLPNQPLLMAKVDYAVRQEHSTVQEPDPRYERKHP
jgi:hypothetical protein